jgi:hypothetical protein
VAGLRLLAQRPGVVDPHLVRGHGPPPISTTSAPRSSHGGLGLLATIPDERHRQAIERGIDLGRRAR